MSFCRFRSVLRLLTASLALGFTTVASAEMPPATHGIAMHGDLKYAADFPHFDYTNPDAPKGGEVRLSGFGTFDSFNPFIIKGTDADGIGMIYDSLTEKSRDEPFSEYGRLAKAIYLPEDRSWIEFELREEARFSDGEPVQAEDVVYTFQLLREQGAPFYRAYYAGITDIRALGPTRVRFEFSAGNNPELPLIVGEVPILPKHYWRDRDFSSPSLDIPIGSGPYIVESFDAGRSVSYKRNPDYWGRDLPVNRGRNNFDRITYDYYRDNTVALEAFKAGEYDFRQEYSSKDWATGYTGSPFDEGRIIKRSLPDENPVGMQAFIMNTRRPEFSDARVRQALAYAFDFEWTNKNLFYGAYTRSDSFFSNSEMAANQLPTTEELKILEPIRDQVPPEVFTEVYHPPTTNGDGRIRGQLRKALRLLREAGWELDNGVLKDKQGNTFDFEILLVQKNFERVVAPMIKNLERMGISAHIRIVDVSQYVNRVRQFEFDMIVSSFGQSNSPGNEQREYWHSEAANQPGSRNYIGIENPAVDYLVEKIIQAPDRKQLVLGCRALDRVLQWNHYVIPQYHIAAYRIAYWNKFAMPETPPRYDLGFDTWWIKP